MGDFQADKFDAVIVYDIDRMFRRVREAQLFINRVEDSGLRSFMIASATGDYDLANPDERDEFRDSVKSAEKYSRQISRKVARKNLARARNGQPRKSTSGPTATTGKAETS
jgi:DNA invertase Pin-like site-specific DNA recombinase